MKSTVELPSIFVALLISAQSFAAEPAPVPPDRINTREELHFVTGHGYIKTTAAECEIRGGQYEPHTLPQPSDMVDCSLLTQVHQLGTSEIPRQILGSAYDYLYRSAIEKQGYGLYSYVLLPSPGMRSERLLQELFKTTSFVELVGLSVRQLNLVYLPVRSSALATLIPIVRQGAAPKADAFAANIYDYAMAQTLLARICAAPSKATGDACRTDLSVGPYIVTYTRPASAADTLPVPFLFLDLSEVHEQAFGEMVAAYKEQIKGPDFSARDRVDSLRLRLLSVMLTSADWLKPLLGEPARTIILHD